MPRSFGTSLAALAATCALSTLSQSSRADASAPQKAAAEALFDQALNLMKASRYAEACPKLEQSQSIDPGIGTLLYLGECYERTGRTASAWATFREAASSAQAHGETDRARVAADRAQKLEPDLSHLTIQLAPETRQHPGLSITRNGIAVEEVLFGVAVPVDPGVQHVEARAPGCEPLKAEVSVGANHDAKSVTLPGLTCTAATAEPTPLSPPTGVTNPEPPMPDQGASHGLRNTGLVVGAVGVVGLAVGSFFGVRAISKNSDAEKYCPRGNLCDDPRGESFTNDAKHAATLSNVSFAVGAAAVVGGLVLYLQGSRHTARLELSPTLASGQAGITLRGAVE